jgi:DNA polymerase elongation subunit (family B)
MNNVRIPTMASLVFDIETLGLPPETLDDSQREYLLKYAETDQEREAELQKLSLYPLTAQVLAIGMLNPETRAGRVLYQSNVKESYASADGKIEFLSGDESFLLKTFWEDVKRYDRIVTFNGRGFDCPFLMIRSAVLSIAPSRNLVPYRYDSGKHCDLLDQLTFYGATRKFNLDFYCKAFGIRSPKAEGITGADLAPLVERGDYRAIAEYCIGDVIATAELYRRWSQFLNIRE